MEPVKVVFVGGSFAELTDARVWRSRDKELAEMLNRETDWFVYRGEVAGGDPITAISEHIAERFDGKITNPHTPDGDKGIPN